MDKNVWLDHHSVYHRTQSQSQINSACDKNINVCPLFHIVFVNVCVWREGENECVVMVAHLLLRFLTEDELICGRRESSDCEISGMIFVEFSTEENCI